MPAAVDLRLLRAAVFAAACVALAAVGHLGAAGPEVPPWTLAVGWLALWLVCIPLAGRQRRSLPAMAALLAAAQFGLHALFSLGHAGSGQAAHAGDDHTGTLTLARKLLCNDDTTHLSVGEAEQLIRNAGLPVPEPGATAQAAEVPLDPLAGLTSAAGLTMIAAHLLAALAAGWVLLRGEAALWRLLQLSARTVPSALQTALALAAILSGPLHAVPAAPRAPLLRDQHHPTEATSGTVLCNTVVRRGPPDPHGQLTLAA